ncbi:hypothetical protein OSB04_005988 [Centaurea solstitialis]|uniref:Reverse transcriptase Ty1/copia-type domain-containing protein n=1 Tax=Centaurea solstitialis TaxID=347529 RepID=A0AA38U1P5_9ASTR|nr:hypothetical protein OSB04_005988 [Centaurea solstitialis]
MATHLLNILPSTSINFDTPHYRLYQKHPSYSHLRVFRCLCYPHITTPHKLASRSTPCVFLGYPSQHRGFRCLDLSTRRIIISRHVVFDESILPFGSVTPTNPPSYSFLNDPSDTSPIMHDILHSHHPPPNPTAPSPNHSSADIQGNHLPPSLSSASSPTPHPTHPMTTRSKSGIDPNWRKAMDEEYRALITNKTWELVPRPPGVNVVRSMWLFRHKYHADGSLARYKARLVANGRNQQQGIDCDETFSPVVKPATIRTVLSIAVSQHWPIHHLDVKNAFLHVHLQDPSTCISHRVSMIHDIRIMFATFGALFMALNRPPSVVPPVCTIISQLGHEFAMTDLGALNYFLGISASRSSTGLFLSQQQYATQILERANMLNCNPARTPIESAHKLGADGPPVTDPTLYRSLAGALQYLIFTRLEIAFAIGGCPASCRSTSGYCVFLGDNLVSWSSKRQGVISRSSAETEYRGVANAVAETSWIRNLLRKLHRPPTKATIVYCDNVSAVYMSSNPVQHQRKKHIEMDIHFVRDKVVIGHVRVLHVPSSSQYADIFTKGLSASLFLDFRSSLNVRKPDVQTAGGC